MTLELAWNRTPQAAQHIQEMRIPPQVIRDVLDTPERTYETGRTMARRTPNGPRRMYCRGKVAILVSIEDMLILAVLWTGGEPHDPAMIWEDGGWIDY